LTTFLGRFRLEIYTISRLTALYYLRMALSTTP